MAKLSEMDAAAPSFLEFGKALWSRWFSAMSGGLSVPLTIAAFWVSSDLAKVGLGILAFLSIWSSAYAVWKTEREKLIALIASLPDARRKQLTILRSRGVEIRNRGQVQNESSLQEWIAETEQWERDVLARVPCVPCPSDNRGNIKVFNEHDFRLVKLEELIKRYGD